jgi:hypothetical protein
MPELSRELFEFVVVGMTVTVVVVDWQRSVDLPWPFRQVFLYAALNYPSNERVEASC